MKFGNISAELQAELVQKLEASENKSETIVEVIEKLNTAAHEDLIKELQRENEQIKADSSYAEKMGMRTSFTQSERKFYDAIKQAVTFTQADIIPTEVIDRTLEDVKKASNTLKLVNMAPAGVKKWLTGSHTGVGAWGSLTSALTSELTATISGLNIEVNKAYVLLIVPKAVRELALPLVDKYFSAILAEAMNDVLVKGYIAGNGVNQPIGLAYKLPNAEGAVVAKTAIDVEGFGPADIADVKTTLSNGGKRAVNKLYLIANPTDVYTYVDPALYVMTVAGNYVKTSKDDIEVIEEPNKTAGTAIITIDDVYTMGMSSVRVDEYKELKALDDADLFIGKAYANGRADDDNAAVVINVTQLKPAKIAIAEITA